MNGKGMSQELRTNGIKDLRKQGDKLSMPTNTSIKNLQELKAAYDEGLVSVLVGAGFSKNVYKSYPTWPELLEDIVKELFPSEYKKVTRERQRAKEKDWNKPLNELVNRLGPLNIVSQYIAYRGVGHEAIDVYVESKIPALKVDDNKLKIKGENITQEALSAHEALLNCEKFRNIYTTNYENVLEATRAYLDIPYFKTTICNSQDLSDSLSKQSIIKVHGDLRTEKGSGRYEFDGDKSILYIISKDDYETYQQKHEAFSFMMRLAMLQGKFCLVGFSGNDPNFQFWLHWMKDILDKEENNDIKVFLIDFFKEDLKDDVKLFYANHHIGVINLLDIKVQGELFPDKPGQLDGDLLLGIEQRQDWKNLITALFVYLKGEPEKENRKEQGKYYSLWSEAAKLIKEKKDVSSVVRKLLAVRSSLGPQKSVEHQNDILNLLHRKRNWSESEIELFTLAVSDTGMYPFAFDNFLESNNIDISQSHIWKRLHNREESLAGEETLLEGNHNEVYFENALRLLFGFRFTELKALLDCWTPTGEYVYRISLLQSFYNKEKAVTLIDQYLTESPAHPAQELFLASQIANLIYGEYPVHYDLSMYYDQGLSTLYDIVTKIGGDIATKKKKILPFSVEDKTIYFSSSNRPFRESLRILTYLLEWGYTTYYKYVLCISGEVWLDVFVQLFEFFPFPMLYFSSQYTDEKLLKRIGQEYAYSKCLHKENKQQEILQHAFCGLSDKNLPVYIRKGLLIISSEIYVSVKEEVWYDDFKKVILLPYISSINENNESRDSYYINIAKALANIYQREHVEECFRELLRVLDNNPRVITGLINDYLQVSFLKDGDYDGILKEFVSKSPLANIYPIMYVMNYHKLLSKELLQAIDEKATREGLSFVRNDRVAMIQLSYILTSENNLNVIKEYILEKDVWNCGIGSDEFSPPSSIAINKLSDKITWKEEERARLFDNLEKNLTLIINRDKSSIFEPIFFSNIADLLFNMLSFFGKYNKPGENKRLEDRIKGAFESECEISHNLKGLASDDEAHVYIAMRIVNTILSKKKIVEQLNEIYTILNRVLQKNQIALSLAISEVSFIVCNYEDDMWNVYQNVLMQILRDYKDVDYRTLNLNLSSAYRDLNEIAKSAKRQGLGDKIIDYWISDSEVLRFNNVH